MRSAGDHDRGDDGPGDGRACDRTLGRMVRHPPTKRRQTAAGGEGGKEEKRTPSTLDQWRAERRASGTVGQVMAGVEGMLAASVSRREGQQHLAATSGGKAGTVQGEDIFQ